MTNEAHVSGFSIPWENAGDQFPFRNRWNSAHRRTWGIPDHISPKLLRISTVSIWVAMVWTKAKRFCMRSRLL